MSPSPVVVITGASSGLGRATAQAFAKRHARLVLVARGATALDDVAREATALGAHDVATVAGDTSDQATTDRAVDTAIARNGRIDLWINAAAVTAYGTFWEQPVADFERVLEVDINGYANGVRSALRAMMQQRHGLIVNVASILGEVPQPYSAAYSMSKAAVIALGRSVRSELSLAKSPVHVVTVLPPTLDTPIFHHSGNVTGHELKALPPVYPASDVVDVILAAWKRPGKPERTVTGPGKVLVRQHKRRPVAVEGAIAKQTQVLQLGKPTPDTTGNLYTPSAEPHTVSGGWGGRRRKTGRVLLLAGLAAGAAYALRSRRSGR